MVLVKAGWAPRGKGEARERLVALVFVLWRHPGHWGGHADPLHMFMVTQFMWLEGWMAPLESLNFQAFES